MTGLRSPRGALLLMPLMIATAAIRTQAAQTEAAQTGTAQIEAPTRTAARLRAVPLDTFSLANGMRVVVSADPTSPVVVVSLRYGVGDESGGPAERGYAERLREVSTFLSGSLRPGERGERLDAVGAAFRSELGPDHTTYTTVLPPEHLPLGLWLEGERMRGMGGTETARTVLRSRAAAAPGVSTRVEGEGSARRALQSLMSGGSGSDGDGRVPDEPDVEALRGFHERVYTPAGAVLVVTGQADPAVVRSWVKRVFGSLGKPVPKSAAASGSAAVPKSAADPERGARVGEPPGRSVRASEEIRREVVDPAARLPIVYLGVELPARSHPDMPALLLLATVLSEGERGRLVAGLVREAALTPAVVAGLEWGSERGMLLVGCVAAPGVSPERLERALREEVASLLREGVTASEVERARNRWRVRAASARLEPTALAERLQETVHTTGVAEDINREEALAMEIDAAELTTVARRYLASDRVFTVLARSPSEGR